MFIGRSCRSPNTPPDLVTSCLFVLISDAARPPRHRFVPARVRRQRVEHVRAGARPARAGARRDRGAAAAGHASRAPRTRVRRASRARVRISGAGAAVRQELLQERTPLSGAGDALSRGHHRGARRSRARPARTDVPAGDSGRAPAPAPCRLHRSRLLARLLLVRPDLHSARARRSARNARRA